MNQTLTIRRETPADHAQVEALIRQAFWNLYVPGCSEHYLAHIIRPHPDFIPELDLVAELGGRIVGSIMYTRARLVAEDGSEKPILTFGPVCIHPDVQRRGWGKQLIESSFQKALELGYDTVVIFGDPGNYVGRGFRSCRRFGVTLEDGSFPAAMLVKELIPGVLGGKRWVYYQSPAFDISEEEARKFDDLLEPWEKKVLPCQEEFYILSHATLS
ncbi:MAG: N-acetyltransferase [Clostridiales bacterium]|nr:N-acetyltransferase [Clostridiales bacterium]